MIATILSSSSSFSAVDYNEEKVKKGTAELLERKNFDALDQLHINGKLANKNFLIKYSSRNDRVKNKQFHVAISCKGQEYTFDQLVDLAHQYLEKMGYGDQPVLIYGHHDTDNNHIHIITSRIGKDGKKIDDHMERVRSQKVLEKLLGENRKERVDNTLYEAFQYKYANINQFKAILESTGYDTFEENGDLHIARSGEQQMTIPIQEIEKSRAEDDYLEEKRRRQMKAILLKYREMVSNKEELKAVLKEKFGLDLIFVGKKDKPYGYMIVDHKEKAVYKGSAILPLKKLLVFTPREERLRRMDEFIDSILGDNNRLTTRDLNRMLRRQFGTYVSKGKIISGKEKIDLPDYIQAVLKRNDKAAWLQSFHPATEQERAALCRFGKIDDPDLIKLEPSAEKDVSSSVAGIRDIPLTGDKQSDIKMLSEQGYVIQEHDGHFYCIDVNTKRVFNMKDHGLDMKWQRQTVAAGVHHAHNTEHHQVNHATNNAGRGIATLLNSIKDGGGGSSVNREHEVGNHGSEEDIDDERTLKRQ